MWLSGESASILIEEKENEQRGQSVEKDEFTDEESLAKTSNHVSLLQRDEQQFYDNLLVMYNCSKCAEVQGK